jgi:hypothetical protein
MELLRRIGSGPFRQPSPVRPLVRSTYTPTRSYPMIGFIFKIVLTDSDDILADAHTLGLL